MLMLSEICRHMFRVWLSIVTAITITYAPHNTLREESRNPINIERYTIMSPINPGSRGTDIGVLNVRHTVIQFWHSPRNRNQS